MLLEGFETLWSRGWISIFVCSILRGKSNTNTATERNTKQHRCILGVWSICFIWGYFSERMGDSKFCCLCSTQLHHSQQTSGKSNIDYFWGQSNGKTVFKYISVLFDCNMCPNTSYLHLVVWPIRCCSGAFMLFFFAVSEINVMFLVLGSYICKSIWLFLWDFGEHLHCTRLFWDGKR